MSAVTGKTSPIIKNTLQEQEKPTTPSTLHVRNDSMESCASESTKKGSSMLQKIGDAVRKLSPRSKNYKGDTKTSFKDPITIQEEEEEKGKNAVDADPNVFSFENRQKRELLLRRLPPISEGKHHSFTISMSNTNSSSETTMDETEDNKKQNSGSSESRWSFLGEGMSWLGAANPNNITGSALRDIGNKNKE